MAICGVIVSLAMGAIVWPVLLFGVVGGITQNIGRLIHRHRRGI